MTFRGIRKAALAIAYDNGVINRDSSEEEYLKRVASYVQANWLDANHAGLRAILYAHLREIDAWLDNLSENALETVCAGEETEVKVALKNAPVGTDKLLNGIFEDGGQL